MAKTVKQTTYSINNTINSYNGGFIAYWKLYTELLNQKRNSDIKINPIVWFLKSIWWLFIKPIGFIFHKKTDYNGDFSVRDGIILKNYTIKKKITIYILRILPIFTYRPDMKVEDFEKLID